MIQDLEFKNKSFLIINLRQKKKKLSQQDEQNWWEKCNFTTLKEVTIDLFGALYKVNYRLFYDKLMSHANKYKIL